MTRLKLNFIRCFLNDPFIPRYCQRPGGSAIVAGMEATGQSAGAKQTRSGAGVSCLVPAYNEGANIGRVLAVLQGMPCLHEIIVLDDGSSDNTSEVARQYQRRNPAIRLLASGSNRGKTDAIRAGVRACRGEIVVIIDSDLINLRPDNVARLIAAVRDEGCALAILDRAGDRRAVWGWTDCARFFGGERAFRRNDFMEIEFHAGAGYLLEIIMNLHFMRRGKKIKTFFCSNLFTLHDHHKNGFRAGFGHYWKMSGEILAYSGVINFIRQVYCIEEDRLARLYAWHARRCLKPATVFLIPAAALALGWLTFLKLNLGKRPASSPEP